MTVRPLYDTIGRGYAAFRRPDPRLASAIEAALGDAASIVNIGAGAGSYEPVGRKVIAVEPSDVMIRQRPAPPAAAPCIQGRAESLPFESGAFEAAMTVLSMHHWSEPEQGLREMARVARRRVVLLTWVPDAPGASPFWLTEEYFPEILAHDRTIFPSMERLTGMLERTVGPAQMTPLLIPHDCMDGMLCAYWRRPKAYLNAEVRSAISSFARLAVEPGLARLRDDLASGYWLARHRALLNTEAMDLGYRIVQCEVHRARPACG